MPLPGGLLIRPDHVPAPAKPEQADDDEQTDAEATRGSGGGTRSSGESRPAREDDGAAPTRFYAQFQLDRVRGAQQLSDILESVAAHLGTDVELDLELRAANTDGYSDHARRTVSENAQHLNAKAAEFE